jgi:hypothetical protein
MTVETAQALAAALHAGQVEKFAPETPFYVHLERVAARVEGETPKVVAYLHEVVEEGKIALETLEALGATPEQLEAIALVSRVPGETYAAYIEKIAAAGGVALYVKLADLKVHFAYGTLPATLAKRYTKALTRLAAVEL